MADARWVIPFADGVAALVRRAIESDTDGLRTMILGMIRANAPAPREVFVKPNKDGTWPVIPRGAGTPATLMWLRSLDASTLAPMPTAATGYLPTDLVFPVEGVGGVPVVVPKGMFASDSLTTTTVTQAQDYTGDPFAGGQPITWAVDKSRGAGILTDRRARLNAGGLDVYDGTYVYSTFPTFPTRSALRTTFTISTLAARNEFAFDLRGPGYGASNGSKVWFRASADGNTVTVALTNGASSVDLGTAPLTAGTTKVTLDDDGATQVGITVGTTTIPTANVPDGRGPYVAFYAGPYSYFNVKNLTVEVV